jgi:CelD/BcsL family acetyltransferase involved in cellulose biosynthesis
VRFEQARTEAQCREGIDRLVDLHNLRWQGRGGSDAFHTAELVRFHRTFAPLALKRGWLRLFTLWVDERPAACLYGFVYQSKFYFYQSGFHPDFEKNSVGLVLMGMAIERAIEEGAEEFDFLHGDEPYKRHWAHETRVLSRLELYPPTSLGWVSRSSRELVREARGLFRRRRANSSAS